MDPCFESSVAYASALKECEDEGIDELECRDSWEPAYESILCMMRKIEEAKIEIGEMLKNQEPPIPIPWPIDESFIEDPDRDPFPPER